MPPVCTHTMVSSVIFLVDLVGTERWVVCAPFMSGMSRRTFWLVLLHSEYNWQWYRNDTWDWKEEEWEGARQAGTREEKTDVNTTDTKLFKTVVRPQDRNNMLTEAALATQAGSKTAED